MCADVPQFDPVSNDKTSAQTGPIAQETLHLQVFSFALNQSLQDSDTVEPRHTTTPLIWPPRYYDHFFADRTKAQISMARRWSY